jgi:ribosomal protein S18 acetylase RimI-like enzyme
MTIIFMTNTPLKASEVSEVFKNSGIKRPYNDLPRIQQMIDQADVTISAWAEGKLVGIARGLTDFVYCCYLSDLAVVQDYQKLGIGKELIRLLREHLGEEVSLVLISAPTAMDFYEKNEFIKSDKAFLIARKR